MTAATAAIEYKLLPLIAPPIVHIGAIALISVYSIRLRDELVLLDTA